MKRALVLLTVLAACSSDGSNGTKPSSPVPTTSVPPTTAPSASPSVDTRAYERPCDQSVFGDLGRNWKADSLVVGPVGFVGLSGAVHIGKRALGGRGDRALPQKVLAVVEGGDPVTVAVAPASRNVAALIYDPNYFNTGRMALAQADVSTTFHPCGDQPRTQFNGGLLVLRPTCVRLEVAWTNHHRRVGVPFAGGRCR
jgi:hypothetical protein